MTQFRKHLLVEDRPYDFVVQVALSLASFSFLAAVLDVEEAEVQWQEIVNAVAFRRYLYRWHGVVGKCSQFSCAHLECSHGRPPCLLQSYHGGFDGLVYEFFAYELFCDHV